MKDYGKNNELSYIQYWDVIIYIVGQYHKSFQ